MYYLCFCFCKFCNDTELLLLNIEVEFKRSKKMKPTKTGLEFMLMNYSSEFHKRNLRNESSAGANAAFKANTTVSTADPLSEIVWSPDKGFGLKCVDSSFKNKNTSLFRDVEPSSMVLALLQSVACGNSINDDKPTDNAFVQPLTGVCVESDVSSTNIPIRPPTSDSVVIIPECKPYDDHDTGHFDRRPQDNESKPSFERSHSPTKHCKEGMYTFVDNKVDELEDDSYTRVEHVIEEKCSAALGTYIISSFNCEAATSAVTSRVLVSKSVQNKNKSKVNEMMLPYNKNGIHSENYHSKELFLESRKRCKQEVIIESKKVKMQIQETSSYSKSHVERDSSFMNLISNMMKGYSQQSSQDDVKSSALAQIRPINFVNSQGHWKNNCKVEETREQFSDNQLFIETKNLHNCCINKEASSTVLKDEKGNSDHISKHNVDHVTPFSRFRDSEPMVSMFAKRLGAIKQCQQTE
ncbi:uncharacterized protein LOC131644332 isoform X2 [Vicia villosa]|uniref:uncharacterized protein LOC131644332 isoform X2 n=1 Tax=Vicia villosa TaxID=3911 RepID=UPI00273CE6DF|nr:uncharacterized protein LOC131644332 isoform X2 [Vicia villosa]